MQAIANQLGKVGIKVTLQFLEIERVYAALRQR